MPRRPGWRRAGRRRPFRYLDESGRRIRDPGIVERLDALVIPPAWTDVWIAPSPHAKVQATGIDAAGRKQYRYHDAFRARQEEAKYEKLIRLPSAFPTSARQSTSTCRAIPSMSSTCARSWRR